MSTSRASTFSSFNQNIQGNKMVGLQSLYNACQVLYPDQPNPLQVTARLKYWLGGADPLDYVSMYWNPGKLDEAIPPHWHYISFGLSDLHGDGRVHPLPPTADFPIDHPSGFGIELTMRVLGEPGTPPVWPAALLQRLATYIFTTGNCLYIGDHVSWHTALDGGITLPPSDICHIVIAKDPHLTHIQTPLGKVQFVQVVGITKQELKAAQRYGGAALIAALEQNPRCGGAWHVTDMKRRCWVEVPPQDGPSDLSGVAAHCQWDTLPTVVRETSDLAQTVKDEIKCILQKGLSEINSSTKLDDTSGNPTGSSVKDNCNMSTDSIKFIHIKSSTKSSQSKLPIMTSNSIQRDSVTTMSTDSFTMSEMENALMADVKEQENMKHEKVDNACLCEQKADANKNKCQQCSKCEPNENHFSPTILYGVHLMFDQEAASLLPLALRGRVLHKSHFTWSRVGGGQNITLLGSGVTGSITTPHTPIVALRGWLQILLPDDVANNMMTQLSELEAEDVNESEMQKKIKSYSFQWDKWQINISVL